ncbi:NADPH oxidase 5 [Trichogramma pretiosum]|uniref:NADPH oxidase 5 n=1 Tax=Trichogramma pretiosum TaxID=7493 RepID=UPI0006C9E386|nr:NADPH oxidase 5 [Trichogramma pretiosum]
MSSATTTQPIQTDPITADPLTTDSIRTELITAEPVKGYEFENKKAVTKLHENTWMSLIEQCITILSGTTIYATDEFKNLFQNEVFITKVFQLFDQDMDGVIKQDDWMKKIRLLVSNKDKLDQIESIINEIVKKEPINFSTFKKVFDNTKFLKNFMLLLSSGRKSYVTATEISFFLMSMTDPRNTYDFNLKIFKHLKKLYLDHTSNPRGMTLKEFMTLVNIKTDTFGKRIFALFDKDGSDFMTWPEFMDSMQCYSGKQQDKLRFLFNMYDSDGNGLISKEELAAFLKDSMAENGITLDEHITHGLASALFADANPNKQTGITFEALKNQIEKHDGLLENLTICSDKLLVTPGSDESKSFFDKFKLPRKLQSSYIKNNYIKITFLAMYVLTNLIIFVSRAYQYKDNNGYFILAKACGRCLSFNIPFSFILMLRQCITFLRNRGFNNYLPLDHHIYLHKLTGINITILSIVHTVMHFGNLIYKMDTNGFSVPFRELTTGILLLLCLIILFIFSLPFIRQKASFEIFYRTHLLCMLFIAVGTIGHVTAFYYWISGPLALFIIEFFYRHASQVSEKGKTYSTEGVLLPSRVTHLRIKKPRNFDFRPGDYVFVNIPVIAYWEWHPFTISSAPEEKDYFSLHIRGVGGWTNNLYSYLDQEYIRNLEYRNRPVDKYRASVGPPKKVDITEEDSKAFNNLAFVPDNEPSSSNIKSFSPSFKIEKETDDKVADLPIRRKSEPSIDPKKPFEKMKSLSTIKLDLERDRPKFKAVVRAQTDYHFKQLKTENVKKVNFSSFEQSFRYKRNVPDVITFPIPKTDDEIHTIHTSNQQQYEVDTISKVEEGRVRYKRNSTNQDEEKPFIVNIQGPFGTPSSHIFQAQHAVIIATGIGVTPFASILQSIMHRYKTKSNSMKLQKVDFFWLNRSHRSFEWFVDLLTQLEIDQAENESKHRDEDGKTTVERFLEMHMYVTSAPAKTDMKAVALNMGLDLLFQKEKLDFITGLKTRSKTGRPDWDEVFQELKNKQKGKITVFYCGPPQLGRILRKRCEKVGFGFRKESF